MALLSSFSNTLIDSSLQPSSVIPPMTNMNPTMSAAHTGQGVRAECLSSQTSKSLPYWIDLNLERGNPYAPYRYYAVDPVESALSAIPATCGKIWSSSYVQWAEMEISKGFFPTTDSIACYTYSSFSPYCVTETLWTTKPPDLTTLTESTECYSYIPETAVDPHCQTWSYCRTYEMLQLTGTRPSFSFTPSAPCCGTCVLSAGDVQVYHWPQATAAPSAPAPSVSMLVNSNGFTL
jgi:hypothetical protein